MAFVETNPRYRSLLQQHRLSEPEEFLALPGLIVSGHPERNVARVVLGDGPDAVGAFLKREHRVRRRDRLASAWAGFGFASRSVREALTLQAVHRAGVGCPAWLAVGEDNRGRAFLLLREVAGAVDLRRFLREHLASPAERRRLARRLGTSLARLHQAGFNHPDLYSKHVLVARRGGAVFFLDWQRSRRRSSLSPRRRYRDLAALDATIADELATPGDRLACLYAYLRAAEGAGELAANLPGAALHAIRRASQRLLRKRHVQEARLCPALDGDEGVIWLDGEALCVTDRFWAELEGRLPSWLETARWSDGLTRSVVDLPGGRRGLLVRRRLDQPLRWFWLRLRRRPLISPELRQAGALFVQWRHGVAVPRLLAFGQRRPLPWRTESFLLTEMQATDTERDG